MKVKKKNNRNYNKLKRRRALAKQTQINICSKQFILNKQPIKEYSLSSSISFDNIGNFDHNDTDNDIEPKNLSSSNKTKLSYRDDCVDAGISICTYENTHVNIIINENEDEIVNTNFQHKSNINNKCDSDEKKENELKKEKHIFKMLIYKILDFIFNKLVFIWFIFLIAGLITLLQGATAYLKTDPIFSIILIGFAMLFCCAINFSINEIKKKTNSEMIITIIVAVAVALFENPIPIFS